MWWRASKTNASKLSENRSDVAGNCGLKNFAKPRDLNFNKILDGFTDGTGFDTVIDAIGRAIAVKQAMPHVKRNGELILLGTPRGEYQADLTAVLQLQADSNLTIKGAHEVRYPTWKSPFVKHSREQYGSYFMAH